MKRSPIRKISAKKQAWRTKYLAALKIRIEEDSMCRRCRTRKATEGHHPLGQAGAKIMIFDPFCRTCHDEVESNKKQARKDGWILYR